MNESQKTWEQWHVVDAKFERYAQIIAEQLDHKVFTERVNAEGMCNTYWEELKTRLSEKASDSCGLLDDFVEPLAEFLDTFGLLLELSAELEKKQVYNGFRPRMNRGEVGEAVQGLLQNYPELFNVAEAANVPLEDRGEWLYGTLRGNL